MNKSMQDKNVWLYTRVSRDEDGDFDSIENQQKMLRDFAKEKNLNVVGESSDNNISGMTFIRKGLDELNQAIDKGLVQLVLVKDMSRLGRRQSMTALYIDELTEKQVEVFSITENISTFNENDSLIIGFKGLINDSYSRDLSRKIYSGFKQRQKDSGVVIIPPFGYIKDRNNDVIIIYEECATIIRLIFELFLNGMGIRKISNYLNSHEYMPPSYYQKKFYNKGVSKNRTNLGKQYVWYSETVSRILSNKAYIGILECNKTYKNSIKKIKKYNDKKDYIVHENYFPPIISNDVFESAQLILNNRKLNNIRATANQKIHRYAGLIECVECGANFTAKKKEKAKLQNMLNMFAIHILKEEKNIVLHIE